MSGFSSRPAFRVVILSGMPPGVVAQLADRITREVPGACVAGVLCETLPPKRFGHRARLFRKNLRMPGFVPYSASRIAGGLVRALTEAGHRSLRWLHGAPAAPNGNAEIDHEALGQRLGDTGGRLLVTLDMHSPEALAFVRGLEPDLGIVFGTRILKPQLFEIPRHGCINIHKRKVPNYRGGGAIGLWELLDEQPEIGITVHRVATNLDAGEIVRATTIPIEPFDTLDSLELKADVVGADLLVQSTADYVSDSVKLTPQQGSGRMFKTPTPYLMRKYRSQLEQKRAMFRPTRTRPVWKLMAHVLALGPRAALRNQSHRRGACFPVVILYHHVISDRPHKMGIPTAQFERHVRFLQRHYRIASLPAAIEMLARGRVDVPTVVLTFDDGYADNFVNVRAVTEPLNVPVTFFICSERVTTGVPFDHDVRAGEVGFVPLTWEQVAELRRRGFGIGSHTRTHFDCGSMDPDRLLDEIVNSRKEIEARLGEAVPYFAFPAGQPANMSSTAVDIARRSYDGVFSACGGVNRPGEKARRWHFLRCPHPASLLELEMSLQGILELDPHGPHLPF